ncbi:NHL domain-containing protein [Rhizosphaericola mali]|uniref:T9SS type A sorting domain-containing protein n=1 Tax=Rhizosphaericola mali TaxID=2545455 RepID=A0A5P2G6I0_9BACT|nr:T9SS type A sorting domain-containing protein [Rhizosphaericola mali]QES89552.1 T9SS type A sorting domain-containing protein [Rhizosphaericola mali]
MKSIISFVLLGSLSFIIKNTFAQTPTIIAGNSTTQTSSTGIGTPNSIAVDDNGNIYLSTGGKNVILKIGTDGTKSIFAGLGTSGYSGDGGTATSAQLNFPTDITIQNGILYIADLGNNKIRTVNLSTNIIQSVDTKGVSIGVVRAIALDANDNIYVTNGGQNTIKQITSAGIISTIAGNGTAGFSGDNADAKSANLNGPTDVVIHENQLYFTDMLNRRIRKIDLASNIISTVAGNGTTDTTDGGLGATNSIALDNDGNVYVGGGGKGTLKKIDTKGTITSMAGIPAISALTTSGNDLLLADPSNSSLYQIASVLTLPVTWENFTAFYQQNNIKLSWTTATEINNKGFTPQRSTDGKNWINLAFVPSHFSNGTGNGYSYSLDDQNYTMGTNYYRIQQTDLDGQSKYSSIISINVFQNKPIVKLYPNPVIDQIHLSNAKVGDSYRIISLSGQMVQSGIIGSENATITIINLHSGMYIFQILEGNQVSQNLKFVKK